MQLEQKIAAALTAKKHTLALAESCSGGLLSHTLTGIPGASAFFLLGIIAYDNAAKVKVLKVPAVLIKKYGAVSMPVAEKMAVGARRLLGTTWGLAVTGIAGPSGGTKAKPVGLTYIAVTNGTFSISKEFHFNGNRAANKKAAANAALTILWQILAKD